MICLINFNQCYNNNSKYNKKLDLMENDAKFDKRK